MDDGQLLAEENTPLIRNTTEFTPSRPSSFIEPAHASSTSFRPSIRNNLRLWITQSVSFLISSSGLLVVVGWAVLMSVPTALWKVVWSGKQEVLGWDNHEKYRNERHTDDVRYYAREAGFDIVEEEVQTDDGFLLRVHRVTNPRTDERNGKGGYPVLLLHGLFQSSGAFITSEERSIAFWLAENGGYQVFLGNTRGVFGMGHTSFSRSDPRFWDWTLRELALYDLPAMVTWICDTTGYDKVAFIGHSQGNATAFMMLSQGMRPEIGKRLSCFIALAPAVYAGPLTHGFPFTILRRLRWDTWKRVFGVLDFIPSMRYAYAFVPARPFAAVGYIMFAYLFSWKDTHWLKRRKIKMFRFTPTPVSSASIFWWCGQGGFAQRKCTMDISLPEWFDERFPPLSIYYGGQDFLVATDPLLERLETHERHVTLQRVVKLDACEHCDFYLAANAPEWCFTSFLEDIERTRTDGEVGR